ncbi:sensor histidine kinase [Nonomuraea sp. SYSU D8015]|uniref:sensor histidine kinase n=1 Tax=Nonomuraea sp. SYSU D8015 TaxID=2593644 RepID=UPI0016606582|nr:sensor histidine kinase [Nonomuraea sp. SYSU D8015]
MVDAWNRLRTAAPRSATALIADSALGALFLVLLLVERLVVAPLPVASLPVALTSGLGIAVGLALRRRTPLAAFVLGSTALLFGVLVTPPSVLAPYANQIGVYSVGLHATRRRAHSGLIVMIICIAGYFAAVQPTPRPASIGGVVFVWVLAWLVGYGAARRREEQLAARRLMRRQAVAEERARIARELHDLVGHTVNLMLVQAGAGRRVLDRDPAKARELLAGIEQTGRAALTELDRVLGVLRRDSQEGDGEAGDGEAGAPGLADLPALAERMTKAGIGVRVRLDPALPELPRSLDLSAYRIVQETLTNALKHGDATSATVTVRRDGGSLDIDVRDDGHGSPPGYQPGRGLLGIGERVALFGGTLEHGPSGSNGFRVRAVLPLPGNVTSPPEARKPVSTASPPAGRDPSPGNTASPSKGQDPSPQNSASPPEAHDPSPADGASVLPDGPAT